MYSKRNVLRVSKKLLVLISLIFILSSCGKKEEDKKVVDKDKNVCENPYKIGTVDKTSLKLKGIIVSDDVKTVSSPMAGTVDYLNCNAGEKVYNKTLIAKISPDFNNPSIVNISIQKGSLVSQRANLQSVKNSTASSFDTQMSSIDKQINSLNEQKTILKKNIELTKKSSNLGQKDLKKQIEGLENNLSGLETSLLKLNKNLDLAKKGEKEALEKVDISKKTLLTNIKAISKDNLLKIDEIFGFTSENKDLNDKYDDYLGMKDSVLLNKVKSDFNNLNIKNKDFSEKGYESINQKEISKYLGELIELNQEIQKSIKNSIENVYLPQTQIDQFYTIFLTYGNNITEIKNSLDSLDNSKDTIKTNYSTQITNLESQIANLKTQIKSTKTNIENLKTNKLGTTNVALDLQLSNIDAQLKTLSSNLENLVSQKANLLSTKKTQLLNLDNQILQINQNIASLNTNLQVRNIYAKINGTVKQKVSSTGNNVGPNTPLCQIIPNTKSTKIKIFSPIELNLGDKLLFNFNSEKYEIIIENVLIYKDPATQNYVYESNYLDKKYFKDGEILSLEFENNEKLGNSGHPQGEPLQNNKIIKIPLSYIRNKIDGNFVKIKTASGIINKKVELGDINGRIVEVEKGIKGVKEICK